MAIRKMAALVLGAAVTLSAFAGCATTTPMAEPPASPPATGDTGQPPAPPAAGGLIGISMPSQSLERWNKDGAGLREQLEALGYTVQLDYGDDKPEQQIQQIENQINADAKVLVIAAIDGKSLGPVLEKAAAKGTKVLAYDRLIMNTPNVDYYATFDNYQVGALQGAFIKDTLQLDSAAGPFNFEPFAGSPDDNNAGMFFNGAWDVLKPFVDSGKLVIQSETGKKALGKWEDVGILAWKTTTAQSEMENRLNSFYTDKKVNAVLSPNDSIAQGIAQALQTKGYTPGTDWPVLTGQDGDVASVKNMQAGKQSMTVWKDTRELAKTATTMVDQIVKGQAVTVNDEKTYNNGKKVVPSMLLMPQVVVPDTIQDLLVKSGYIAADKLS